MGIYFKYEYMRGEQVKFGTGMLLAFINWDDDR